MSKGAVDELVVKDFEPKDAIAIKGMGERKAVGNLLFHPMAMAYGRKFSLTSAYLYQ